MEDHNIQNAWGRKELPGSLKDSAKGALLTFFFFFLLKRKNLNGFEDGKRRLISFFLVPEALMLCSVLRKALNK
jgi:hypothetical protein